MATDVQGGRFSGPDWDAQQIQPPQLLVEWSSPWRTFLRNLRDLFSAQTLPPIALTAKPGTFWPDVFVSRPLPFKAFRSSIVWHMVLVALVWIGNERWLMYPPVEPRSGLENSAVIYYPVSEYLPPINDLAKGEPAKVKAKGQPAYARQRIVSMPRRPDNQLQTIVTPAPPVIHENLPLPNLVVSPPSLPPLPTAAATGLAGRFALPEAIQPVAPPPEVEARNKRLNLPAATVVPPPPDVVASTRLPKIATAAPIEPAPAVNNARTLGSLNVARRLDPGLAAPPLAVPEQRTPPPPSSEALAQLRSKVSPGLAAAAPVPPPISERAVAGIGGSSARAAGQLIALNVHPVAPTAPIEIPEGTRRGTFAAGPEGKPDAPGTVDGREGGKDVAGGHPSGRDGATAGILVAAGPVNPGPAVVAAAPSAAQNAASPGIAATFAAMMRPARPADLARQTHPGATPAQPNVEGGVFGGKRYYSMVLNMPNLSSTGGSWIIRFAELKQSADPGDLTAPVAMVKVDPAYPAELMRTRLEGMVVLYAIIRADGSVDSVRVLRGVDRRLDSNACAALGKWRFRPAMKSGTAIDAEAVVQIPFQARQDF